MGRSGNARDLTEHEIYISIMSQRIRSAISLALHVVGVFLFLKGFFLTRNELAHVSKCVVGDVRDVGTASQPQPQPPSSPSSSSPTVASTWGGPGCTPGVPRRFRRVIVVVVDALRFDFLASQRVAPSNDGAGDTRFCQFVSALPLPLSLATD